MRTTLSALLTVAGSSMPATAWAQIINVAEPWDDFGHAVAVGDFDGDGDDDLAIGVPEENSTFVGGLNGKGCVHVIYSIAGVGLDALDNQVWTQDGRAPLAQFPGEDIEGDAEEGDFFGSSLAAGDFDGDGVDDLAIGAPDDIATAEDTGLGIGGGVVNVLYGVAGAGLTFAGNQIWHQDNLFAGALLAEAFDRFGTALTTADFDGDGFDDLAVGVSGEDDQEGAVTVLYGTGAGLSNAGAQLWDQDTDGLPGTEADVLEFFGHALTAGDFDGDGFDDLAIGAPFDDEVDTVGIFCPGGVNVLYGSAVVGLATTSAQNWNQDTSGNPDDAEDCDEYGNALAAGDFNDDGFDDLAIGAYVEDVFVASVNVSGAGAVDVLYGTTLGVGAADTQFWTQAVPGVLDTAEVGDLFGSALVAGDFDGDGFDDLAVGAYNEAFGLLERAGAVNVLRGSAVDGGAGGTIGLSTIGDSFWNQGSTSILGVAEEFDEFGYALAAGDFDGDGTDDLAIGVHQETLIAAELAGAVNVLYGSSMLDLNGDPLGLQASNDQIWHQNQ